MGLLDELALGPLVLAGYDIGSRIAQAVAQASPDRVRALVVAPPAPGAGRRVLDPAAQTEFWYQHFYRLPLAEQLLDCHPDAVRSHLPATSGPTGPDRSSRRPTTTTTG